LNKKKNLFLILLKGGSESLFFKLSGALASLILQLFLTRNLSSNDYGMYVYLLAWVNSFVMISILGIDKFIIKNLSSSIYKIYEKKENLIAWSIKKLSLSILLCSIILAIILYLNNINSFYILASLFLFTVFSIRRVQSAIAQAYKYMSLAFATEFIRKMLLLIALSILIYYSYNIDLNVKHILITEVLISSVVILVFLYYTFHYSNINIKINLVFNNIKSKEWNKASLLFFWVASVHVVLNQSDIIMLGMLESPKKSGYYNIVYLISNTLGLILMAVNAILAPIISEAYTSNDIKKLGKAVRYASLISFFVVMPVAVLFMIYREFIISLFGSEYLVASEALNILLFSQIFISAINTGSIILSMTEYVSLTAKIISLSAILNIILNVVLIPLYGITGAAISYAICTIFWNLSLGYYSYNHLNISPVFFIKSNI